jgi:acyl carrier protein
MGLDMVELILTVEEEFDIDLPDRDMEKICTPRDLANYIHRQYQQYDKEKCSSQVGFYKIRKLFMEHFKFERHTLHPDTKLQDLFKNDVKKNWKQLLQLFDHKLYYKKLGFTPFFKRIILLLSILISLSFWCCYEDFKVENLLHLLFVFPFSYVAIYFLLNPIYATIIPDSYTTLASLIKFSGETNKHTYYKEFDTILEKVIEISIEQLGLSPSDITPDSKYVEDLGAG